MAKNSEKLLKEYGRLLAQHKKLQEEIKNTHIEIEWLEKEKRVFAKSPFWKLGYFLKNFKLPKK